MTCGCGLPAEKHQDVRHLTYPDLVAAADAAGIKPKKAVKNLRRTFKKAQKERGKNELKQIIPEAQPKTPGKE